MQDVERNAAFYRDIFGFVPIEGTDGLRGAAFLRAADSTNDHDLGLIEVGGQRPGAAAGGPAIGL